jgi:hypothetical protein
MAIKSGTDRPSKSSGQSADEKPYGNSTGGWHQVVSKSDECDSLGGVSKNSQQVKQNAPDVPAHPPERTGSKDSKTFDAREPKGAGDYAEGTRSSISGTSTRANKRV